MTALTNNTSFEFKISPRLMSLRSLIGMFILVNAALASHRRPSYVKLLANSHNQATNRTPRYKILDHGSVWNPKARSVGPRRTYITRQATPALRTVNREDSSSSSSGGWTKNLKEGNKVFVSAGKFKGKKGTIMSWIADRGKWYVELDSGRKIRVSSGNLENTKELKVTQSELSELSNPTEQPRRHDTKMSDISELSGAQIEVEPETRSADSPASFMPNDQVKIHSQGYTEPKPTWTLAAQKAGSRVFGRSKDSSLSAIRISHNKKGKQEFRLVHMIKGGDQRFYFSGVKRDPQDKEAVLNLTEADFDRENNCVLLRMKASGRSGWFGWTRPHVCDRRIFYLDHDGPKFIQFLITNEYITYDGKPIDSMDLFKRQTKGVIGYTVTLMKNDWLNTNAKGLMSSSLTNWTGLNKMMEQTCQLRVHMSEDNETVKRFEISQLLTFGNLEFGIEEIMHNEEQNSVLLKLRRSDAYRKVREDRTESFGSCVKNVFTCNGPESRYLYLGANTDSKKFLLFLLEMYHKDYSDRENTSVFTKAAAAAIPTIFQGLNAEGKKLVKEYYIEERDTENAAKFETGLVRIRGPESWPESFEVPPYYSRNKSIDLSSIQSIRSTGTTDLRRRRLLRLVEAERRIMQ